MPLISDAVALRIVRSAGDDAELVEYAQGGFWGIFDFAYLAVDGEIEIEQRQPLITCRTLDVQDIPKGTVLKVRVGSFRIARHEPDGAGETRLVLSRL